MVGWAVVQAKRLMDSLTQNLKDSEWRECVIGVAVVYEEEEKRRQGLSTGATGSRAGAEPPTTSRKRRESTRVPTQPPAPVTPLTPRGNYQPFSTSLFVLTWRKYSWLQTDSLKLVIHLIRKSRLLGGQNSGSPATNFVLISANRGKISIQNIKVKNFT